MDFTCLLKCRRKRILKSYHCPAHASIRASPSSLPDCRWSLRRESKKTKTEAKPLKPSESMSVYFLFLFMCVQMDYNAELMKYLFVSVAINHRVKQGRCEWEVLGDDSQHRTERKACYCSETYQIVSRAPMYISRKSLQVYSNAIICWADKSML